MLFPGQLIFSVSQTCSPQQLHPAWNVITKLIQERKKNHVNISCVPLSFLFTGPGH